MRLVTPTKGEKGYMPMVGHIAETGFVIGYAFREGNAAPAAGNLAFLQACERNMPKGKKIAAVRAGNAAYQAAIFNSGRGKRPRFSRSARIKTGQSKRRSRPFPSAIG